MQQSKIPTMERWSVFEIELRGPAVGYPFTEVELMARFRQGERTQQVRGFYDGDAGKTEQYI